MRLRVIFNLSSKDSKIIYFDLYNTIGQNDVISSKHFPTVYIWHIYMTLYIYIYYYILYSNSNII